MIKRIAQYSILALFLAGLGAQCPAGEGASTNDEDLVRVSWVERTPIAKRPLIFPRIQNQYYLFRNLILNYPIAKMIDRPLFYDRSLLNRKDGWGVSLVREFKVHMRNAADYGVDGLGVLTHSLGLYQSHRRIPYDAADLIRMDNFNILTEFCGQSHPDINKMVEYQDYILCRALASPYSAKINGKIVLSSYCGDLTTPEEYAEIIRRLRAAHGDSFYYMVDIGVPSGDGWKSGWGYIWLWKFYKYGGAMPKKDVEALQAYLRRYLDVCDGIHIAGAGGIQAAVTGHLFCREFYRDFLIPVLCGVLAESPYRQKLLGLSASGGHLNHYAGGNFLLHQEGTKTLRDSLDIALKAHPDYIVLPEWNEVNENTFIQPTIYNSLVTQRLLKYYTSRLKGRPPAPNPGDDRSVPNLMVSFRRVLELGEKLEIELLNIPDDTNSRMYAVEFRLLDENGKEVHRFPPQEFNGAELQEHRLTLPSETLAAYRALQPVLIVRDDDGDMKVQGLCPIRLRPTWNSTHTWAKHSLRDVCRPNRVDFRFTAPPACDATNVAFTGEVECGEDIMSVEIVEDETEMYAVDPENEYTPRADEVYLRVSWNSLKRISPFHMQISVKNGELRYFRDQHRDGNPYEERYRRVSPSILETSMGGRQTTRGVLMIATNKRQSTLVFKTNFCKYEISAARIAQEGLHIANFENGFVLTIETPRHLMDNPMPIRQRRSTFRASFPRLNPEGVYHLRVVTASGKVYRSRPLLVPLPKPESRTTINVYSETQTGVVPVTVQTAWLPDITYRFTPQYGGVLPTSAGYSRYGILGGGLTSGGPFNSEAGGEYYPPDAVISAPRWMEEDGMACLKFDGKGNYIWFPLGVLPMGEFTLEFEIKPLSAKPQIVFKARGHDDGQLTLYLENGKLWGVFNGRLRESDPEFRGNSYVQKHTKNLRPNIDVPLGEWSRVRVTYNLKEFVFSVNGKDAPPIPYDRRASCLFSSFVFGGHGKYKGDFCFFDGYLRALRIRHYAVPAPDKGKVE